MQKALLDQIKKTVVFLGFINDKSEEVITGTGFLVQAKSVFHLVTAKHVPFEIDETGKVIKEREELAAFLNLTSGQPMVVQIKIFRNKGLNWIYSQDPRVDIAIIPFGLDPENHDVKTIPEILFLEKQFLLETYEVFFVSYQPGISVFSDDKCVKPIVRHGMIARINSDQTFYIDGSAFPGNSGSPVFLMPSAARITDKGVTLGGDELGGKFIGVVGSYVPYQDVAVSQQTGRPRIIFEENTGLSKVWSVDCLWELMNSEQFNAQISSILKNPK